MKSVGRVRVSLEVSEAMYRFAGAWGELVGVGAEEFLYAALCHALGELIEAAEGQVEL